MIIYNLTVSVMGKKQKPFQILAFVTVFSVDKTIKRGLLEVVFTSQFHSELLWVHSMKRSEGDGIVR